MPWINLTVDGGTWAVQTLPVGGGYFDPAYFDPAYFDTDADISPFTPLTATGTWTPTPPPS